MHPECGVIFNKISTLLYFARCMGMIWLAMLRFHGKAGQARGNAPLTARKPPQAQ
jgi:hypothetical protein